MELAEAAQREALRELQPRPERRAPAPGEYRPPAPLLFRDTRPAELFATLSRCVRQAILLQARLDSGAYDRPPPVRTTAPEAATRPATPRHASHPGDGTYLDHERLEDDLAIDATRAPDDILTEIHEQLSQAIETPILASRPTPPNTQPETPDPVRPGRAVPPARPRPKPA